MNIILTVVVGFIVNKELYILKDLPKIGKLFKYRQYCWNEQCFGLKKYDVPKEFCNKEYYIRIEQQSENSCTYKCWNGGEKHGEYDLIIKMVLNNSGLVTILVTLMMNGGLMMKVRQTEKNIYFSIIVIVTYSLMVGVMEDNLKI